MKRSGKREQERKKETPKQIEHRGSMTKEGYNSTVRRERAKEESSFQLTTDRL